MGRDLHAGPTLDTHVIQGDILPGLVKREELLLLLRIGDPELFVPVVQALPLTTAAQVLEQRVDGVFVLTGATRAEIDDTVALHLAPVGAGGWSLVHEEATTPRSTTTRSRPRRPSSWPRHAPRPTG